MKTTPEIRILVVEDDHFFQRVLQKRLTKEGYQVIVAGDGREGMKAIVAHSPDLVISDWMMPEVDGLELCQAVKTGLRDSAPYFILLTAKGEISDKLLALETGADDYLVKPCDQGELMARVRAGLRIVLLGQDLRRAAAEMRHMVTGSLAPKAAGLCPRCRRVRDEQGQWHDPAEWLRDGGVITQALETCGSCLQSGRFGVVRGDEGEGQAKAA
jgi:PleD family two-component response regulator